MKWVAIIIGVIVGAMFDEWRGALFVGALAFVWSETWTLKQRVADLARLLGELRVGAASRTEHSSPPPPQVREPPPTAREVSAPAAPRAVNIPNSAEPVRPPIATNPSIAQPRVSNQFSPFRWVREFFTGGNTVVRVSVAILFVGVVLLLQYANEHGHFPIEVRLIAASIGTLAMLVLGWRLRKKRFGYAIALQGGATGILYLIVFFAMKTYALLPASLAFVLLLALVVLSATLAVLQDAVWLALIGISGGFLAPILTSTGQGSHIALFTFYAVLNVGIVLIAWFKAWRALNVVGFAFTFVIGVLWGVQRYSAELFASTEPFLILFFLMYVAIAILFAARQETNLKGYVDGTIVFGVPIAAFALQSALLYDQRYWLAISAVAVSALYVGLATLLWRRGAKWRLLAESFVALGVAFATLAIPLALNGRWSAATWALEGAALVWVGCRQSRLLPRLAGIALQIAGAAHLMRDANALFDGPPIVNSTCLGALLIAGAAIQSSRLLHEYRDRVSAPEREVGKALFFWALLWWCVAGIGEITRRVPDSYQLNALVAFAGATSFLSSEVRRRLEIAVARWAALWLLPAMGLLALRQWFAAANPFGEFGWVSWPLASSVFYFTLRRHETETDSQIVKLLHVSGAWLLAFVASRELAWLIDTFVGGAGSWPAIAWAFVPAVSLLTMARLARALAWPVQRHEHAYTAIVCGGFALYLLLWSLITSVSRDGDPYPLPYVPFLNPLDLAQAFVLLAGVIWLRRAGPNVVANRVTIGAAFGVVAFVWLNAVLLRTIHYWAHVPYVPRILWSSTLVQSSLSIFWTTLALATMVIATKRAERVVWWVGGVLMSVVVIKLFIIDLSRVGSIARIVSFLGAGLLMLVIGYFAPIPPRRQEQTQ